jgi:hypothetical protein
MFKQVEYVGFDGHPGLKQIVESLVPLVERELRTSSDRIKLEWVLKTNTPKRIPEVELLLSDDWAGTGRVTMPLTHGFKGIDSLVRDLHRNMLNRFLEERVEELKQDYATTSGS